MKTGLNISPRVLKFKVLEENYNYKKRSRATHLCGRFSFNDGFAGLSSLQVSSVAACRLLFAFNVLIRNFNLATMLSKNRMEVVSARQCAILSKIQSFFFMEKTSLCRIFVASWNYNFRKS